MTRAVEALLCVGLSLGAHFALMGIAPRLGGVEAQGDAGAQLVSMAASTAALETLVEQWDAFAPPDSLTEIAPPASPTEALDVPQSANTSPMPFEAPPMAMTHLSRPEPQSLDVVPPEAPKPPAPPAPAAPKSTPAKPAPSQPVTRPNATQSEAQKAAGTGGQTARGTKGASQEATRSRGCCGE